MAKVGSIKAYHDGAAYDVADIYDEKKISVKPMRNSSLESADSDTVVFFYTTADGQYVEETGATVKMIYPASQTMDIHPVGDYNNYFVHCSGRSRINITFNVFRCSTGLTLDGVFYYPPDTFNRLQRLIQVGALGLTNMFSYGDVNCFTPTGVEATQKADVTSDTFASPFHFAFTYTPNTIYIFVNGVKSYEYSANVVNINSVWVGNSAYSDSNGANSDISCSFLRVRKRCVWTDSFEVPFPAAPPQTQIPIAGNIPIYHNNQTYYAPLVTEAYKQSPCLAVRHNNQTYYTVRS